MFFISIGVYDLHCRHATGRKTVQAMTGIVSANMPDKDAGSGELHEATRGGEQIVIRRAKPKDKELYLDFLREVSAEDLRLRFFAHIRELSAAEADKLGHLDYSHDMVFVALDESTGQMLGLVRLKDELDEQTAEFAILVRSRSLAYVRFGSKADISSCCSI